jgi:hypothetical protein
MRVLEDSALIFATLKKADVDVDATGIPEF